ncbi:MAG: putative glutamine amidotransferase [Candidatus Ordinivivax streblomastigis]|uniref:Putative glutamine amidotransferase n=1 Tax=Candidatus Ordinivivax streblomastigis TaxID=2540710 RepID=A0A5M8NX76_9BACT|nr:MAG: putative glutamine amidotransferase [Candidatus Ordinivivax streblomastigis]
MLIGLSVNHKESLSCISDAYANAVIKAGGVPVLIPLTNNTQVLDAILSQIDGLILTGGGDIHPSFFNDELHPSVDSYNVERDRYDLYLARKAAAKQMPILGICRGHQVLNVAFGGNMIQDIPSQVPQSKVNHNQLEERPIGTHQVRIIPNSGLHEILKKEHLLANSFHHQAVKTLAPEWEAVASTEDGIIEAIESTEGKSIIGVQWHPENMAVDGNDTMLSLFRHVVDEAGLYRIAMEIHKEIYSIDSHCDTPMYFKYGINIGKANAPLKVHPKDLGADSENGYVNYELKVDIPKMQAGLLDATFMVAYLHQGARDAKTSQKTVEKTESIIRELISQVERNKDIVEIARSADDLKRFKKAGKKAIFIGIENGYGLGKDLSNVQKFADMGVSYITLSHNGDNDLCDAAMKSRQEHKGLSAFGKEVVQEMNRLGVMVDISHTSEKTSLDVLEISRFPVIASHSSVKALCNHPRNISDKLMRAIAEKGGVIQICLYSGFLRKEGKATVKDAVNHIDYVVKTVGIDHVGIGSDFDGGGELKGLKSVNEMPQITLELLRRGYSKEDIAKIWGGNLMRIMEIVQSVR